MLDHKIPPPVVALAIGLVMWQLAPHTPALRVPNELRWVIALTIVLAGIAFEIGGLLSFRRARTTVNPLKPEKTSALVTSGIYRYSRNPMYVGMLLFLCGWAVFLSAPLSLLGTVAFVLYINRFQIAPEERAMLKLFGAQFEAYRSTVRRWL